MDCPLNWAHQQDRKAEALVSHGKFADAIVCHQKASEFLQEAMKMTQVKQALVSLQLQFNNHCRQQRILKEKWKHCEIEQEKWKQEQTKKLQEKQNQEVIEKETPLKTKIKNSSDMTDGKNGTEFSQSSSLVISAENFSVSSTSSLSDCATSKDEKSIIQDLEGQVRDLQMQVLSLSQNLEDCNRENSRLRKALDSVHGFVKLKFGCELEDDMFDFSLIKSQCTAESEAFTENTDLKTIEPRNKDQASLHGKVIMNNIQEETGNDSHIDEDIPLPPLETPQFIYDEECSEKVTV